MRPMTSGRRTGPRACPDSPAGPVGAGAGPVVPGLPRWLRPGGPPPLGGWPYHPPGPPAPHLVEPAGQPSGRRGSLKPEPRAPLHGSPPFATLRRTFALPVQRPDLGESARGIEIRQPPPGTARGSRHAADLGKRPSPAADQARPSVRWEPHHGPKCTGVLDDLRRRAETHLDSRATKSARFRLHPEPGLARASWARPTTQRPGSHHDRSSGPSPHAVRA